MNPWPFVAAAYALTLIGVGGLVLWAAALMRRSEAKLGELSGK